MGWIIILLVWSNWASWQHLPHGGEGSNNPTQGLRAFAAMRQNEGRTTEPSHTPSTKAEQLSRQSCNQIPRGRYQRENWTRAPHGTNRGGRGGNNRQGGEPIRANHQARKSGTLPHPRRSTIETAENKRHTDGNNRQETQEPKRGKPQRDDILKYPEQFCGSHVQRTYTNEKQRCRR